MAGLGGRRLSLDLVREGNRNGLCYVRSKSHRQRADNVRSESECNINEKKVENSFRM